MKPLQVLLTLFIIALLPLQAADLSDLTYITTGERVEKVTITDCKILASGTLVIPTTINGNPVTSIGPSAFDDCINLTSITMPDSVTSIGQSAFARCSSLTSITIPDGVTSIGRGAFYMCSNLTSITIPDGVTSIGDFVFYDCLSLTSTTLPDGVTSIGDFAFYNCEGLTSITIPDSVTSIGQSALARCSSLTSIKFEGAAPTVGGNAFSNLADGAAAIITPENKTSFGDISTEWNGLTLNCLDGALTWAKAGGEIAIIDCNQGASGELVIPDTIDGDPVTSIGDDAFRDCTSLTSITIPDSVTSIERAAFFNCTSLTSITIGNGVTSIGYGAFGWCIRLTSITIPDSVVSLGDYAFGSCLQLTTITIGNGVTSIGDYAFDRCNSLTSITIGNGVTSIEREAFLGCTSLTSITFPDSVTSIGDYAFKFCRSLTSVTFQGIAPTVGIEAFSDAADGAVALLTSENFGSYKWNGLTLTDTDQSDTIAQLEAQLAQMTAERDARPTQTAYDMVVTERDARPTIEEVKDARLGSVVLQSDVANQSVKIRFSIEESDDFRTWTKRDEINEITVPLEVGKRFYRFALEDE